MRSRTKPSKGQVTQMKIALALALTAGAAAVEVSLVTWDGADGSVPLSKWAAMCDPVMGGVSTGSWALNATGEFGTLDAEVKDVPSLQAPGFATAGAVAKYPDASAVGADGSLVLSVRSPSSVAYTGFRVSFAAGAMSPTYSCAGGGGIPFSRGCFKADFSLPAAAQRGFVEVSVPLASFSDKWSSATGDHTAECADEPDACVTAEKLRAIQYVEVWAEGVDGVVRLDVQSLKMVSAAASLAASPAALAEPAARADAVAPVAELDAAAYLGRWFQTYASLTVKDTFQLGGNCVTADYASNASGVIAVTNTVRLRGTLPIVITGYASQNADLAGELEVFLGPRADPEAPEPFATANYWIIGLGPRGDDGKYAWATVSDPSLHSLYVLARDVDEFAAQYEADVLATLAEQGFTGTMNKPRKTNQDGCEY